jgi:hypothetical protein
MSKTSQGPLKIEVYKEAFTDPFKIYKAMYI